MYIHVYTLNYTCTIHSTLANTHNKYCFTSNSTRQHNHHVTHYAATGTLRYNNTYMYLLLRSGNVLQCSWPLLLVSLISTWSFSFSHHSVLSSQFLPLGLCHLQQRGLAGTILHVWGVRHEFAVSSKHFVEPQWKRYVRSSLQSLFYR